MSSVTGTVVSSPCITMPSEVADQDDVAIAVEDARGMRVIGRQANDRLAALAGADVRRGKPPDVLMHRHLPQCPSAGVPKRRQTYDERMEHEAERKIENRANDDRDDIVAPAADRNRRSPGIAAPLQRNPVVHRPGEHRAEQDDAAEIAIGAEMREGPDLDPDQHRMLEHALDIAWNVSGDDSDACRPHQRDHDLARPCRRIP